MNLQELRTRTARNVGDINYKRFPISKMNAYIQDGYALSSAITGSIQKSVTFPFPDDTPYINLREQIPDYFAVLGIYNLKTRKWIPPVSQKALSNSRSDWERWTGEPSSCFFVLDFNRICILPYQTIGSGLFVLWYLAAPQVMVDGAIPVLPFSEHLALADYATGELQDEQKEFGKSPSYIERFYRSLHSMERLVNNLASNDKELVLQPYKFMSLYGGGGNVGSGIGEDAVFIDNQTPIGAVDGINGTFRLPSVPIPAASLCLFRNGLLTYNGVAYTISGSVITFTADYIPSSGDLLRAWYRTQ